MTTSDTNPTTTLPSATTTQTPTDLTTRLRNTYNNIAHTYNAWTLRNPSLRQIYTDNLLSDLALISPSRPLRILELGCGCGLPVTKTLLESELDVRVFADDLSEVQIGVARENLAEWLTEENGAIADPSDATQQLNNDSFDRRLTLHTGDMTNLHFPPSTLTAVLAFYSILHLPRTTQTILLQKVADWLEPGGYLVANFSAEETESTVLEGWMAKRGGSGSDGKSGGERSERRDGREGEDAEGGWVYWSGWGAEGMRDVIKGVGLEILREKIEGDVVKAGFWWVVARKPEV